MSDIGKYFDYASATPLDARVKRAMDPFFSQHFYNPSASYLPAREVSSSLKVARNNVASLLGAKPTEIIFTAGGTEANNLAIHGLMRKWSKANIIVSAIEHDSVLLPAKDYDFKVCPVDKKGHINFGELEKLIDDETVLISVMLANNEIGTIQPIKKISELVKTINNQRKKTGIGMPLFLHSDCAQAVNYLDINVARLGVDLMSINGGKIYGPKQSGALYVRNPLRLIPLIAGGGQEKGMRSGTENVPSIIGFSRSLEIAQKIKKSEAKKMEDLQKHFIDLLENDIQNFKINGSLKSRLPNNVHVTFFGQDNERMMMKLDELGYQVAVGSACKASSDEPSHVLQALGMSEAEMAASLRFSFGRFTSKKDVESLIKAIKATIRA